MAIVGLSLAAQKEYQSDSDPAKGTEGATVFMLGSLDSRIMGKIRDLATTYSTGASELTSETLTTINMNEVAFNTVLYGLRGWNNLRDAAGNDIAFKTIDRRHGNQLYQVVDPDLLKILPLEVIQELANQIRQLNAVSPESAKN